MKATTLCMKMRTNFLTWKILVSNSNPWTSLFSSRCVGAQISAHTITANSHELPTCSVPSDHSDAFPATKRSGAAAADLK